MSTDRSAIDGQRAATAPASGSAMARRPRRRRSRSPTTAPAAPTSCRSRTAPCGRWTSGRSRPTMQDFGLMAYDPAYTNTASCRSAITYIDGDAGILQHRGYPIEQLCEHSSYLEVAYLLINGALPTSAQLEDWVHEITIHTFVHENVKDFMQGFRYDANPMGMLVASVGALSTFYPDANRIHDERRPRDPDHPAAGEDADAGRVRLPPQHGPAVRLPRQRPRLRGQLPRDDVQDDRAQIRARSSPGARAGRAVHPPRRPRTERLHQRRALGRLHPGGPLLGGRRRGRRALRSAARRRQRGGAADARADRQRREHPRLPRGREGRATSA